MRLIVCGMVVAILGCSGKDEDSGTVARPAAGASNKATEEPTAVVKTTEGAKPWDPALGTATISGVVKFDGKPPRRCPISFGAKKECADLHTNPVLDESIIVNSDGSLKNVFVWVRKGLDDWKFPTPSDPVVLDQKGCTFIPHVLGVQTGQPITIRNSDPFTHNVHAFAARNLGFNFGQTMQGQEDIKTFNRQEIMFKIKCDVHTWMETWVSVVDHPYFAVTRDDGAFEISNLPPGEYSIEAQHEELGKQRLTVTVRDKETKPIEFTFMGKECPPKDVDLLVRSIGNRKLQHTQGTRCFGHASVLPSTPSCMAA